MVTTGARPPMARGVIMALGSAAFFGASTPFLRLFGQGVGPWFTAALLYAGAALAGVAFGGLRSNGGRLGLSLTVRLVGAAICGAALAPAALAWGVQRTSAVSSSLVLNLEAVLTIGLAAIFYGEPISRRVGLAAGTIAGGGALLVIERSGFGTVAVWGLLGVAMATALWALDNTIARPLADRDTGVIVVRKAALGTVIAVLIAVITRERFPSLTSAAALILIGVFGYGVSLRLYLLAQRQFGVARTASVFAAGPFVGAGLAFAMGDRAVTIWGMAGGLLIFAGVLLHVTEMHEHHHVHEALEHEHAHRHDDGHHTHQHEKVVAGEHYHRHEHSALEHNHAHAPDLHHMHWHG